MTQSKYSVPHGHASVLDGPYGAVTRQAARCKTSRQALYRDAAKVLQAVDDADYRQRLGLQKDANDCLHADLQRLQRQLQQAIIADADQLARFAATAQAEGVSLPVARRLLLPLLGQHTPSVSQLGRYSHAAAKKAETLLPILDAVTRPQAQQVAADEIFFGRRPCLMVVEQPSSLVECLNSVAWMQQSRHRRMTAGLLALKRLYWNCRTFGTGRRRQQTAYGLLGVPLPTADGWELLRMPPEQLRQQLSAPRNAA